mgnify:CR=1 FL=1
MSLRYCFWYKSELINYDRKQLFETNNCSFSRLRKWSAHFSTSDAPSIFTFRSLNFWAQIYLFRPSRAQTDWATSTFNTPKCSEFHAEQDALTSIYFLNILFLGPNLDFASSCALGEGPTTTSNMPKCPKFVAKHDALIFCHFPNTWFLVRILVLRPLRLNRWG